MKMHSMMRGLILAAVAVIGLSGCATIDRNAVEHNQANPGSAYSGHNVAVKLPGDIPGIPESNGKPARLSQAEVDIINHLDASCSTQIAPHVPGYGQAMVKEGVAGAVTTGAGEAAFSLPFAGADAASYGLGGLAYGGIAGLNTGRIREDQAIRVVVSQCARDFVNDVKNRYPGNLEGVYLEPWVAPGSATLPSGSELDPVNKVGLTPVKQNSGSTAMVPPG